MLNGRLSFSNEAKEYQETGYKNTWRGITVAPAIGYFIHDGLETGISSGINKVFSKNQFKTEETKLKVNNYSINPYIRKYLAITDQLQLHGTGYVSLGFGNSKYQSESDASPKLSHTTTSYGIGFYPGLTYFATPKIGFTASFGSLAFSRTKQRPEEDADVTESITYKSFTAALSPNSVSIGFGYYIGQ
ncbi:hypothetical protein MKJ04_05435 [Pontibacter sp. E15-1]|nr:hypothetical protein [Pontibacter sp. E15-1]MCJ8164277.1 hypothetical protein [Pontibacter sp. E15-1]